MSIRSRAVPLGSALFIFEICLQDFSKGCLFKAAIIKLLDLLAVQAVNITAVTKKTVGGWRKHMNVLKLATICMISVGAMTATGLTTTAMADGVLPPDIRAKATGEVVWVGCVGRRPDTGS
jgi:hypothetical protein